MPSAYWRLWFGRNSRLHSRENIVGYFTGRAKKILGRYRHSHCAFTDELENVLNAVIAEDLFTAWELDEPRSYKHGLPKAHYFLNYRSNYNVRPGYILLDVLYETHRYPVTARRSISSKWLSLEGEALRVEIPSIDSILGDKLTAFAPNTTGVPYGKYKSLEIVKQLHDVGHLFDHAKDIEVVSRSFNEIVAQQIGYRKIEIAGDQVLDDIIETAFMLARTSKHHNEIETVKYEEIMAGMVQFRSYLMSGGYSLDQCVESAAKAAYLAAKLKTKNFDALERYEGGAVDFQFKSMPYNTLNRLHSLRTGSLYYWSKTASLLQIE